MATTNLSTDWSTVQIADHYFSVLQERTHTKQNKKSHKKSEQNKKSPKKKEQKVR